MQTETKHDDPVRISSRSSIGEIGLRGLTKDELDTVNAATLGVCWVRVINGRFERHNSYLPHPPMTDDPMIPPRLPFNAERSEMHNIGPERDSLWLASIFIQHLGFGINSRYWTSKETPYESESRKLHDWGFECLRSRRVPSGQFWEIWFLPGLWCAKGALKDETEKVSKTSDFNADETAKVNVAVKFLCRNANFGTLDVSVQRAALVYD